MQFEQNTNGALIGKLLQNPTQGLDLDLSRIATELEDIARWLKNRAVHVRGQPPLSGQWMTGNGGLRTDYADPMGQFIAGIGRS